MHETIFSLNTFVVYYFLVFLQRPHAESGVTATGNAIRKEFLFGGVGYHNI